MQWVLGSASPRRREILQALGLSFAIDPASAPEPDRKLGETPRRYVIRAARGKALEVGARRRGALVIGADTIVALDDVMLGKPAGREDARRMLQSLSGRWHEVITAIGLLDCRRSRAIYAATSSRVHFRRLARRELQWYLDTGEYADKAGAYAIQGYASMFVDRIEGCYFNIVGFPVATFERLCRRMGIDLLGQLRGRD
jgi:septum formation protein